MEINNVTLNPALKASAENLHPLYDTPGGIAKRCREENLGISESSIRFLCKNGAIPCIKIGRKTLINWNVLMEFLMSGGVKAEQPEPEAPVPVAAADGIRKVPARIKR